MAVVASPTSRARSLAFDVTIALVVTACDLGGSIGEAGPSVQNGNGTAAQVHWLDAHQPGAAYALVVIGGLAVIWRRRWPLTVLAVTAVTCTVYAALGFVPGAALTAVYIAMYTAATLCPRGQAIGGGLAAVVALFVATDAGGIFGWLGGTNTVMVACSIAAVAIGLAVAGRRQVFASMVERAARAERDREDDARRRVDAERLRIARELHDVVAHSMSMINVQAGVAAHVLASRPEQAEEALNAIKVASRDGLRELRAILNVLRQVDEGPEARAPAPSLTQLDALADATSQAGLPTSVSVAGRPTPLPPTVELAAYRIVQESLTNVLRHAGPGSHACVAVTYEPGQVVVQVDDDGQGRAATGVLASPSDPSADDPPAGGEGGHDGPPGRDDRGAGIAGMRERAGAFGGTLEAGARPGGGWRVRAVLPIRAPDQPEQLGQAHQPGQPDQPGQPHRPDRPDQPDARSPATDRAGSTSEPAQPRPGVTA
jgi:signal transduction histidine kinase